MLLIIRRLDCNSDYYKDFECSVVHDEVIVYITRASFLSFDLVLLYLRYRSFFAQIRYFSSLYKKNKISAHLLIRYLRK